MTASRDQLEVTLFGGFSLSHDGELLPPLPSRHARLLFAWLVLQDGRPESRTLLCDRLWPDVAESRARRRLSHALWQVQDTIGDFGANRSYLLTRGDTVAFDVDAPHRVDVTEFERRLDEVEQSSETTLADVRNLRRCLELYGGDLLAGSYEDWVLRAQERLRQRHLAALSALVDACRERGNYDEALATARRLTHHEPLREDAHREVMRLSVVLGRPSQALEQFERCRSILHEELGTSPSAATVELHGRIVRSRAAEATPRAPVEELATRQLVGRDAERTRLVDQLERTLGGATGTVFLEGEPGVGKSRLLAQVTEDARWRGFTVLWGACAGDTLPYAPVRAALQPVIDAVRMTQLRTAVAPVWLDAAASVLPALVRGTTTAGGAGLRGEEGAARVRRGLVEVLTGLAAIEPVVLVVEDVHDADQETLHLLQDLARHHDPGRLLVLLSFRDVEARQDGRVWDVLRTIDREARPQRLHLAPLSPFETVGLLREALGTADVPTAFGEAVHRECGGNPLYVLELLRSMRDEGVLGDDGDHLDDLEVPVTDGLRTVIGQRLDLLGDDARRLLETCAVLGAASIPEVAQSAAGLAPREMAVALGDLARRNLLDAAGEVWRLTHAATRQVVLDRLGAARRADLHLAVADALEASDSGEPGATGRHLVAADAPARALPHLRRAAQDALRVQAYATAAGHLEAALDAMRRVPMGVDERAGLLLLAEDVFDVLGRRAEQAEALTALGELTTKDPATDIDVRLRRARHLGHLGQLPAALEVAAGAVTAAAEGPMGGRALATLGELATWAGDNARAVSVLRDAIPRLQDDAVEVVRAQHGLGAALRSLQRFAEAEAELDDALATARSSGDELGALLAMGSLADLRAETGRTDEAVGLYDEAVVLARRIGHRHREGVTLVNLGTVRLSRGEPGPALRALDAAEAVFTSLGNDRGVAMVHLNRAWLHHRWLRADREAVADARRAGAFFERVELSAARALTLETRAAIALAEGRHDEAWGLLEHALELAGQADDRRAVVQLLRTVAHHHMTTGEHDAAVAAVDEARSLAAELDLDEFRAELAALAADLGAEHDEPAARRALRDATAHLASAPEPHRINLLLATTAARLGDDEAAAAHHAAARDALDDALATFDDEQRRAQAAAVPLHREIRATGRVRESETMQLRVARQEAPRGRALRDDEYLTVVLSTPTAPGSAEERRRQLLTVLDELRAQGGDATVDDLCSIFDVSASTVRRDLRALRGAGHTAATRGSFGR